MSSGAIWRPSVTRKWVVYAKPPFGGPVQVLRYLGRYTHRIAISNERLLRLADGQVSFQWKDYRATPEASRVMTLAVDEFIRRFLLHALPLGFQRIRHYGLLANRFRAGKLELCRRLLAGPAGTLLPSPAQVTASGLGLAERLTVPVCPHLPDRDHASHADSVAGPQTSADRYLMRTPLVSGSHDAHSPLPEGTRRCACRRLAACPALDPGGPGGLGPRPEAISTPESPPRPFKTHLSIRPWTLRFSSPRGFIIQAPVQSALPPRNTRPPMQTLSFTGFRRRPNIKEMIPEHGQFKASVLTTLPKVSEGFLAKWQTKLQSRDNPLRTAS